MKFTRYRQSIYRLISMLRVLETNPTDLDQLLTLQIELITCIQRTDQRIKILKDSLRILKQRKLGQRQSRAESRANKSRIQKFQTAIKDQQWMRFVWRCFGDGIAFIYQDKLALKHMFYKTTEYVAKENAGAMIGKDGLVQELALVIEALKQEVPAMLCDLTNTLRHGDVCLLAGADPYPIEVKTSKNKNARGARQAQNLQTLQAFYETDEAKNFRGIPYTKRIELPTTSKSYGDVMTACIIASRASGQAAISPEPGLIYFCARNSNSMEELALSPGPHTIMTTLNEAKSEGTWAPYYPFTLSLKDPECLFEFLNGDVVLGVILDTDILLDLYTHHGLTATFVDDPQIMMTVARVNEKAPKENVMSGISVPYFGRIFYEFTSIQQLPAMELKHIEFLEKMEDKVSSDHNAIVEWPQFSPLRWPADILEKH